jgi:hypothetical protein
LEGDGALVLCFLRKLASFNEIAIVKFSGSPKIMTGQLAYFIVVSLLGLPQLVSVILAFSKQYSWYYPVIGLGLILNLAYCAWRGERWAYYLLILLSALLLLIDGIQLLAVSNMVSFVFMLLSPLCVMLGILVLMVNPKISEFLNQQRKRFSDPI